MNDEKAWRIGALIATLLLAVAAVTQAAGTPPADTILVNGGIYTVDPDRSFAQAAAIRGGKIVAVGTNEDIAAYRGSGTKVIDLTGRTALPGFHDSHVHVAASGLEELQCPLYDATSVDAILRKVAECAAATKEDWIVGSGWDLSLFENSSPGKELLDRTVPGRPIILSGADGHSAWASSRALELAGITAQTPDPENGVIQHDANGEPSGALRETAVDLVMKKVPPPTPEKIVAGLRRGLATVRSEGITSFIEASVHDEELTAFEALERSGELTAKVRLSLTYGMFGTKDFDRLLARRKELKGPLLNADSVKIFVDGVLEGETAALLSPYLTRPGYSGATTMPQAELNAAVTRFDAMGLQVHMHVIGDAATRAALDAVAAARAKNGPSDHRHHLAHLQLIHPDDYDRFAELGVAANFQALWAYPDEYIVKLNTPQVGPERIKRMYPIGSLRRAGTRIVAGSDWSVSTVNPWPAIEVALTRQDPDGDGTTPVLNADERVDLATMIDAYTINGAWLVHQEDRTGSIEPGKAADIVVVDRHVFSTPVHELGDVRVDLTMLDGKVIYRREQ